VGGGKREREKLTLQVVLLAPHNCTVGQAECCVESWRSSRLGPRTRRGSDAQYQAKWCSCTLSSSPGAKDLLTVSWVLFRGQRFPMALFLATLLPGSMDRGCLLKQPGSAILALCRDKAGSNSRLT
jgi:hypothetical protein